MSIKGELERVRLVAEQFKKESESLKETLESFKIKSLKEKEKIKGKVYKCDLLVAQQSRTEMELETFKRENQKLQDKLLRVD